jgi:23S rRNA G2445 N2-methylase RlmL
MPYRYATDKLDYSDYARGRVLYGLHGHPAYPVRLASEIWQRCTAVLRAEGRPGPYVLYDPCCGGAYMLATIALLHRDEVAAIVASDVDARVLETARKNLSLLDAAGMERRIDEIRALHAAYGKASHADALESALRLRARLPDPPAVPLEARVFQADVTDARALEQGLGGREVDVLIADLPYGQDSSWKRLQEGGSSSCSPLIQMLEALLAAISVDSIVALSTDKNQRPAFSAYRRVERFRLGKRLVTLLRSHDA